MKRKRAAPVSWQCILEFCSGHDCAKLLCTSKPLAALATKHLQLLRQPSYWLGKVNGSLAEIVHALACLGHDLDHIALERKIISGATRRFATLFAGSARSIQIRPLLCQ